MDHHSRKEYRVIYTLLTALSVFNIILLFVWICNYLGGFAWENDPLHKFNYHPACAIIGLVILYGKGLLLYRTLHYKTKLTLKLLHTVAMISVFVLSVISLICVFDSHNERVVPIPNLYSLHSWIGLGTVILFAFQLVCGFATFLYPGAGQLYRSVYLQYHQFFGVIVFILAVLSCHSGITEKVKGSLGKDYLLLPMPAYLANFLGVGITVFAICVLYLALTPRFRRKPLPEEDKICLELHDPLP